MLRAEFGQTMDPNGVHFTADYFLPANSQECQGRRHATLAQRPGAGGRGTICGSLAAVVMGVSSWVIKEAISEAKSCAITSIIAQRKASEQASGPAVDQLRQGNIFRLLKLEHAIFRHPPKQAA